ncbi:hypothetical protein PMIN03_007346 [Paraphaeosphaeria minitans]|uniref:Uncharacterized protein n=1 Tax=Paraphaeosphaeria minitans TaxID=565426 RepID=A0A9P6KTQ3_9PLEO|nr:hypothetical protein PMIN01_03292 [Paraphaeosphaeria minitans]
MSSRNTPTRSPEHNHEAARRDVPRKRTAEELLEKESNKLQKQHENSNATLQELKETNDACFNTEKEHITNKPQHSGAARELRIVQHHQAREASVPKQVGTQDQTHCTPRLQRVMDELKSWKDECERHDTKMKATTDKVVDLEAANHALKQDLAQKTGELVSQTEKCNGNEARMRSMEGSISNLEATRRKLDRDLATATKALQDKEQENRSVAEMLRHTRLVLKTRDEQIRQKDGEVADLRAFVDGFWKLAAGAPKKGVADSAEKAAHTVSLPSTRAVHSAPSRK